MATSSAEKVEKVVNPPQNPTVSSHSRGDPAKARISRPISSEPPALTASVPAGMPQKPGPGSMTQATRYLATLPRAPPAPTARISRIITERMCCVIKTRKFRQKKITIHNKRLLFWPERSRIFLHHRLRLVFVAHALDGDDVPRPDFLAQFADVHVDGAVAHDHLAAPDAGVDLFARKEFSGSGVEQAEQGELLARKHDRPAAELHHVTLAVDFQPVGCVGLPLPVDAFEDGLHAAHENFHLHRLGDVVVGSRTEPGDLVLLLAQGRQKDDHRVAQGRIGANRAAGLHAVHHGHHPVEQNQVGPVQGGLPESVGPVLRGKDLVARFPEVVFHEFEDVGLVVDEQDAVTHGMSYFMRR